MRKHLVWIVLLLAACSSTSQLKKLYTVEDKTVFELVERLKKNASDKEAATELPNAYAVAANKRKALSEVNYSHLPPAERYESIISELGVMQKMYDDIYAVPAARAAVPKLWDPAVLIAKTKNKAAQEYYNQGLEAMTYDNRQSARKAYEFFSKANRIIPGFEDVRDQLRLADEMATIKVIVRASNYYNQNWNYWGFQNDWMQQQIINDLNSQSYRDVRFFTDWDAQNKNIRADRIVELNITELFVGQVYNERYTVNRSKQIQTGSTKSEPPQPIYKTIYATLHVNRKYMQSRAALECRIYDQLSGANILYDRFPGNDDWRVETATFTGDRNALQPEDLYKINNRPNLYPPSRNEVAERLIRSCYSLLINRIKTGVQFGA